MPLTSRNLRDEGNLSIMWHYLARCGGRPSHHADSLVEVSGEQRIAQVLEQPRDLKEQHAIDREVRLRHVLLREKRGGARFKPVPANKFRSTNWLADEEHLIDVEGVVRLVRMAGSVVHTDKFSRPNFTPGALQHLTCHGLARCLVDVGPAAGQGPAASIRRLAHQEDASVA